MLLSKIATLFADFRALFASSNCIAWSPIGWKQRRSNKNVVKWSLRYRGNSYKIYNFVPRGNINRTFFGFYDTSVRRHAISIIRIGILSTFFGKCLKENIVSRKSIYIYTYISLCNKLEYLGIGMKSVHFMIILLLKNDFYFTWYENNMCHLNSYVKAGYIYYLSNQIVPTYLLCIGFQNEIQIVGVYSPASYLNYTQGN